MRSRVKARRSPILAASSGRNDEAKLVAVVPAPRHEGAAVRLVLQGRIGTALLAVPRHPVAFEIAQMGVGLISWEFPRLCQGGSRSSTYTAVVDRGNA